MPRAITFTEAQATLTITDGRITRNEADGGSGRGGGGDGQGVGGGVFSDSIPDMTGLPILHVSLSRLHLNYL
jgi:hypothetical protein